MSEHSSGPARPLVRDDQIRQRAYEIWEAEGRPEGYEWEHWYRASREVNGLGQEGERESAPTDVTDRMPVNLEAQNRAG